MSATETTSTIWTSFYQLAHILLRVNSALSGGTTVPQSNTVIKRRGDELFHGMAEVPAPTVSDEKDLVIRAEAAPINASDTGSAGRLVRYGGDVFVTGEVASTVTVPFSQALGSTFKADDDNPSVGGEGTV